ncbi:unnamed protein product [Caenorhabditis brenneri]
MGASSSLPILNFIFPPLPYNHFPLFDLPVVALRIVLQCFNPIDLYLLTHCSKKTRDNLLGRDVGIPKLILKLSVGARWTTIALDDVYSIRICEKSKEYRRKLFKLNSFTVGYRSEFEIFLFYEGERADAIKLFFADFKSVFKSPFLSVTYNNWTVGECWYSTIQNLVEEQEQPFETIELSGLVHRDHLQKVIENVEVTNKLSIIGPGIEFFFITHFDHLKSCKMIQLSKIDWPLYDLDVFMGLWKKGQFPNLEYLDIYSERFLIMQIDNTVLGFSLEDMQQRREIERCKLIDGKVVGRCFSGVDIEANDGTKATMQMHTFFELFVWKD